MDDWTILAEMASTRVVKWLTNALVGLIPLTLLLALLLIALGRPAAEFLALIGVLFTQAVVLVGVLLRDSADARSHALAAVEKRRSDEREREAERRLRMEAALRGVELISADEASTRNSAALLALDVLEHTRLAVALLQGLWPSHLVNPEAATQLVSSGLRSADTRLQRTAAAILSENAAATFPANSSLHYMPDEVHTWDTDLPEEVRVSFVSYLASVARHLTMENREAVGRSTFDRIASVIVTLDIVAHKDPSEMIRSNAISLLRSLLPMRALQPEVVGLAGPDGAVSLSDLEVWVADQPPDSVLVFGVIAGLSSDLAKWWSEFNSDKVSDDPPEAGQPSD